MDKTRLLFLYSSRGFGGLPRNLSLLISQLDPAQFDVHVALLGNPGDESADIRNYLGDAPIARTMTFDVLGTGATFELRTLRELQALLEKHEIQVLSCHGYKADCHAAALKYQGKLSCRLLTIAHGWGVKHWKIRLYYWLDKVAMRSFDRVILLTDAQRKELRGFGIKPQAIAVVPNGIDFAAYEPLPDRTASLQALGLPHDALIMAFVGRLGDEKQVDKLLPVIASLRPKYPKLHLVVAGDGPAKSSIVEAAGRFKAAAYLHLLGFRHDVLPVYAIADVFVSNSAHEGLANSVMEAMACGVPCAVSDIDGHRELIRHEQTGLLFTPNDFVTAAALVERLLAERNFARQLAHAGRELLQAEYTLQVRVRRMSEIYQNLAKE